MTRIPVTEGDLHAHVDGLLPETRRGEVDTYLATHPDDARRVRAWREQNHALHAVFDGVLGEPLPTRLFAGKRKTTVLTRAAAVVAWLTLGGATGWYLHAYTAGKSSDPVGFARQAAIAHAVYSPEVRHPVEVGADQEAHLVAWLSKRLGSSLKVPHLGGVGYQLVGGRLLPGNQGPVAQFMFQDANGQRLTLYVRTATAEHRETAFRFAHERGVSVFYWIDTRFGYALSGEIDKDELLRIARLVYQQINP